MTTHDCSQEGSQTIRNPRASIRRRVIRIGVAATMVGVAGLITAMAQAQGGNDKGGAPEGTYTVDGVHSSVVFKVKHLKTTNFYGRFNDVAGSFDLRDGGTLNLTIKMDSVNSGNGKRDQHLKSPDFFSVKEFPEGTFKSKYMTKTGDHAYAVSGDLTLHGVTKEIKGTIEHTGTGKGMKGNPIAGIEARATIKRSEFGINYMPDGLGEDVELIVALEGGK